MVYNYFALITFIANILLALFVYFKNPKREINIVLSCLAAILSVWSLIIFAARFYYSLDAVITVAKINFLMMTLGIYMFVHFVEIFPNSSIKTKKYLFYYMIPIPVIILFIISPYFITGANYVPGEVDLKRGVGYTIWAIYFIVYLLIAIIRLFVKYRVMESLQRLQTKYVLMGSFIMIIGASTTNILLPLIKINTFTNYGPMFTLPFIAMLGYSIMRYRLLDIAIFIKKSLVYFVLVTFITSVYILMLLLTQNVFSKAHISVSIFVSLLSAVFIAVTMDPLKDLIGRWTDKIFFKGKYDYYKVLKTLVQTLNSVVKVDELLVKVIDTITAAMRLDYTAIFILERSTNAFVANRRSKDGIAWSGRIDHEDPLVAYISEKNDALVFDELEYLISDKAHCVAVKESFISLKAKVIIPIVLKEKLIGLFVLGGKKSDDIFTQEDIDLLDMISHQISVVLENTNLYEQMLNTAKLALVGTMAAGMAHEIRNPLTSMKALIQMLPDKHADKIFIDKFSAIVGEEINRLSHLTEDLLSFSKPKPHKYGQVNINAVVEKVVDLFEMQIGRKKVNIKLKLGTTIIIYADEEQLTQIFMNMLLNAMQALGDLKEISIETGSELSENLLKYTTVIISDSGVGIPEQNLERIFDPFFTTKKEGTGLGLSICLKIIQEHNGFIRVYSKVNEGTSFKIFLPAFHS
ncbi:MAG: hypothetical protein A2452_08720 [Candidatus Firestonebacteria bacterium RIFOXYC2_FULL_39_67]|nr:MAG: hypothetical protein A2536_09860 [Candidatus Firestonebacteria bacterium RIFOXYD2_FULL_39_29]OGF57040.1 MAG: hypothetical protein A2497_09250 [Candidatus Firestonebacteria bacterium RifOxyC12_full_39_7]OGF57195.1 MAG: hypothetical protein A2452_08720 [Candidatus Firestonebacteria bacterium RIFOXYC2_FULL_39_67]